MLDDSREELEIIQIPQHYPSIFSMIFRLIR
jgi:hypothetical protein